MIKVLLSSHNTWSIYNFRLNLIKKLIDKKIEVHIYAPLDSYSDKLSDMGCIIHNAKFIGRSKNIFRESYSLICWILFLKKKKFHLCLHFGIKPNIYGSIASIINNIPFVNNITGLGDIFTNNGALQTFIKMLYLATQKKAKKIFFQNEDDLNIFLKSKIINNSMDYEVLPGSGVDLKRFQLKDYKECNKNIINFFYVGRLLKSKGIEIYIEAAKKLHNVYKSKKIHFYIVGFFENNASDESISKSYLENAVSNGYVNYIGMSDNIELTLRKADCVVLPSTYREGTPKTLLESCAMGIPIITTDSVGCKNVIEDGLNGFMMKSNDDENLVLMIKKFLQLNCKDRKKMGDYGRKKVENEFDENVVINKYIELLND